MKYCIILAVFFLVTGCSDDVVVQDTKGTLEGRVGDGSNFYASTGLENVEITIEGTGGIKTVFSDASGRFTLSDLGTGTYNFTFRKAGYDVSKTYGFTFLGAANPVGLETFLFRKPDGFSITDISLTVNRWYENKITIDGAASIGFSAVKPQTAYLRLFFGSTDTVSPENYQYSIASRDFSPAYATAYFTASLPATLFKPGTTVHMKAFACSNNYSGYTDAETGVFVYCSLSREIVFSKSFNLPQ